MEPIKTVDPSSCYDFLKTGCFQIRLACLNMGSFFVIGLYCIGFTFVLEVLSQIDKEGDCKVHVFWYCQIMPKFFSFIEF